MLDFLIVSIFAVLGLSVVVAGIIIQSEDFESYDKYQKGDDEAIVE